MPCRLEGRMLNNQRMTNQMYSLTVYDDPHILDKTIDNLKRLRCRRPSLVLGKSVQPLKNRLDLILSEKLLYKFLCVCIESGQYISKGGLTWSALPICFVTSARVESNSTIIFTTISVMAGVGGTLV
jgi:hypothetical protein